MKNIAFPSLLILSIWAATSNGERFDRTLYPHHEIRMTTMVTLMATRGGGVFSRVAQMADDESAKLTEAARKTADQLDKATIQIKETAKKRAEKELQELESQAKRMAIEAEMAARRTALEVEKAAKLKAALAETIVTQSASKIEQAARQKAVKVAKELEFSARKKADAYEKAFRKTAASVERMSMQKVADFERGILGFLNPTPVKTGFLEKAVEKWLLNGLWIVASAIALSNIAGWPQPVHDLWAHKGFGERFFPFEWDNNKKRVLAGCMEATGLAIMVNEEARKFGTGIIAVMYTWGAWVQTQTAGLFPAIFAAIIAAVAWLILANEIME